MSVLSRLLLGFMPGQWCVEPPVSLFLAKSLGYRHTPDLTRGSLPVTGLYLILRQHLPSGVAAKPARHRGKIWCNVLNYTERSKLGVVFILTLWYCFNVFFPPHSREGYGFKWVLKWPLTSVADGGRSSWFPSEIQVAELSALLSAADHQCCRLHFHSPGAQQHAHTPHLELIIKMYTAWI